MEIDLDTSYFALRARGTGDEYVGLSQKARLEHLYVVGKTGTGKSTLLRNLILQDIVRGRGVGVIDPHGSLATELLDCIPPWRLDDLVYFDPSGEREQPVGWNPLRPALPDERHLIAANVVAVFSALWKLSLERTPRLPRVLYQCVRALLELPSSEAATLLCVPRLLEDKAYRERVLSFVRDPVCRAFWEELEHKGAQFKAEIADPVLSRVGTLLQSPDLQRVFGQVRRKVEPRVVMDTQKIFIANLRKGRLGRQEADLIGSFIVTDFESAAYSREHLLEAGETPAPFHLFVDEFQNFTTDSFAHALSEVRKYGLSLTLAQQYRSQMSDEVKSALIGNVGSLIAFKVGEEDAPELARQFAPYPETELLALSRFEVCVKVQAASGVGEPFMATTLPPIPAPGRSRREVALQRSRQRYGMPREKVEAKMARWMRRDRELDRGGR